MKAAVVSLGVSLVASLLLNVVAVGYAAFYAGELKSYGFNSRALAVEIADAVDSKLAARFEKVATDLHNTGSRPTGSVGSGK